MQPQIMITNGGPHPPEAWAAATAGIVFPLDGVTDPTRKVRAMRVQADIAAALEACHRAVEEHETEHLHAHGSARLHDGHDVEQHVDEAMAAIHAAAAGSPWEEHFAQADVEALVRKLLGTHFATNQHVHRLHHCDANPDCPVAQEYRARHQG